MIEKTNTERKKISCIVPAFNEGPRIKNVLSLLARHPLVDEVFVVDDGSSDNTSEIVDALSRVFQKIKFIKHEVNKGKTIALHTGISQASYDIIMLIDADLVGLTESNITELIIPVTEHNAGVSISLRKNSPWIDRFIGLDQISGERVFNKKIIEDSLGLLDTLPKFGFETFLNKLIIKAQYPIAVVPWENVISPYPMTKKGFFKGIIAFLKMIKDILQVVSIFGVINQFIQMLRLKQKYVKS